MLVLPPTAGGLTPLLVNATASGGRVAAADADGDDAIDLPLLKPLSAGANLDAVEGAAGAAGAEALLCIALIKA